MCNHTQDLKEIRSSLKVMAFNHGVFATALESTAKSNEEISTNMAVFGERLKTIVERGCSSGVEMNERIHGRLDAELNRVEDKTSSKLEEVIKPIRTDLKAVKSQNWWMKTIGGILAGIGTLLAGVISLK